MCQRTRVLYKCRHENLNTEKCDIALARPREEFCVQPDEVTQTHPETCSSYINRRGFESSADLDIESSGWSRELASYFGALFPPGDGAVIETAPEEEKRIAANQRKREQMKANRRKRAQMRAEWRKLARNKARPSKMTQLSKWLCWVQGIRMLLFSLITPQTSDCKILTLNLKVTLIVVFHPPQRNVRIAQDVEPWTTPSSCRMAVKALLKQ